MYERPKLDSRMRPITSTRFFQNYVVRAYAVSQLKRDSRRHSITRVSSKNDVLEETSCQMLEVLSICDRER